jgi:hypothetical protein
VENLLVSSDFDGVPQLAPKNNNKQHIGNNGLRPYQPYLGINPT